MSDRSFGASPACTACPHRYAPPPVRARTGTCMWVWVMGYVWAFKGANSIREKIVSKTNIFVSYRIILNELILYLQYER